MNHENNSQKKILFCVICGNQSESRNYCVISCANQLQDFLHFHSDFQSE
uniref:Uncharacterized protein n=1 Tax=Meloidogyne enterolobii TaxID=390850 RepID=A0A6V7ULE1_MELEN|nr:unnamed protein product [Meloidogyne enterolobii]